MSNMNISDEIMMLEENIRSGSLCMFGCWFGRPMDNNHRSCSAMFTTDLLTIKFDQGETLEIWNPSKFIIDDTVLKIPKASKVKWSWFYYGKPQIQENLRTQEFIVNGSDVCNQKKQVIKGASINEAAIAIC
jgi:hypothetical protein